MNARLVAQIAGLCSRVLGIEAAIECARNAVCAVDDETPLTVAFAAAVHHRRQRASTYGAPWAEVTDRQAAEMTASVSWMATREESAA